jgi:chitinase
MRSVWFGFLVMVIAVAPGQADDPAPRSTSFRIVGYLPDYREFDPRVASHLTDLIVFSAEPTATGTLDLKRLKSTLGAKIRAFKTRERVRLILCVGGWERSTHFAAVTASDVLRQAFVKVIVKTCLDERFDGIDLDWEHPKNDAEQTGYTKLLEELQQAFSPHGLVLSVTIAAWQKLPVKAFDAVDWVQVMAYDHPGRHATMDAAKSDIKTLIDGGAPARKLTLGLPLYGRDVIKNERVMTYREIVAKHRPGPAIDEIDNLYFNGPDTIARKTEFAMEAGLAGVMVWELGQDASGDQSLVKRIRGAIEKTKK